MAAGPVSPNAFDIKRAREGETVEYRARPQDEWKKVKVMGVALDMGSVIIDDGGLVSNVDAEKLRMKPAKQWALVFPSFAEASATHAALPRVSGEYRGQLVEVDIFEH